MKEIISATGWTAPVILVLMTILTIIIFFWQMKIWRGGRMENADGSFDDWREQNILYGMALADVLLACPMTFIGLIGAVMGFSWAYTLLLGPAFWFLWANTMTTSTSLRFENPRITVYWIISFPPGILVGLAYLLWYFLAYWPLFGQMIG